MDVVPRCIQDRWIDRFISGAHYLSLFLFSSNSCRCCLEPLIASGMREGRKEGRMGRFNGESEGESEGERRGGSR